MRMGLLVSDLRFAIRRFWRHPFGFAINILGLGLAIAAGLLIFQTVRYELSFENWIPGAGDIYRLEGTFHNPGQPPLRLSTGPGPARDALLNDFPNEIGDVTRLYNSPGIISRNGESFEETVTWADANFFAIFGFEMIAGDGVSALTDASAIVISARMAQKYFGGADALGRTLILDNSLTFTVAGVMRDLPANTHFEFDLVVRFDPARFENQPWVDTSWTSAPRYTYLTLNEGAAPDNLHTRLPDFVDRNMVNTIGGMEDVPNSDFLTFDLIALPDIHLYSNKQFDMRPQGDIRAVYTLVLVGLLILLVAAVNYVNMATAMAAVRARETGLSKVLGATRSDLFLRQLTEAGLSAFIALILAALAIEIIEPWYNAVFGQQVDFAPFGDPVLLPAALAITLFISLASGIYPAIFISSVKPATALADEGFVPGGRASLRNMLVLFQFAVATALIAITAGMWAQTQFAQSKDLGFDKENKLVIAGLASDQVAGVAGVLKQEMTALPGVRSAALSWDVPSEGPDSNILVRVPGSASADTILIRRTQLGLEYFDTYGISPLAGRVYSTDRPGDLFEGFSGMGEVESIPMVINETARRTLGFATPADAVGAIVEWPQGENAAARLRVVGVIPDFHIQSFRIEVKPMLYWPMEAGANYLTLDLHPGDQGETLAGVDDIWSKLVPDRPIRRFFIDQSFLAFNQEEQTRLRMFGSFAAFAILVSCLGLIGLASFVAARRKREISIRKILGASAADIVRLLVWQFSKPVILANVIAVPAALWFMREWLQDFAYRIDLTPLPFLLAGAGVILVAWLTVASQTIRVARTSPAHVLRYE